MVQCKMPQNPLALRREFHAHLSPVLVSAGFLDETTLHEPVYQFDGAMVLELKTLSEICDARACVRARTLHGKHQLMVLRLQSHPPGRILAEAQETADLVTEFRQGLVIRGLQHLGISHRIGKYNNIVSRYILEHERPLTLVATMAISPLWESRGCFRRCASRIPNRLLRRLSREGQYRIRAHEKCGNDGKRHHLTLTSRRDCANIGYQRGTFALRLPL